MILALTKAWVWTKHHWKIVAISAWTLFVWLMSRKNVAMYKKILENTIDNYKKEMEVLETGTSYTKVIFAGNTAVMLLFLINGVFRGAGSAHLAMRALWISNGLNIFLDPLLIFGLGPLEGLGLTGAAWATTIGRSLGVVYQLYHLFNGKHRLVIRADNLMDSTYPYSVRIWQCSCGRVYHCF